MKSIQRIALSLTAAAVLVPAAATADSIDPTSFFAELAAGESVTIRKTVTIDPTTSTAVIDVMFVFDVTGSMGGEIADAKTAAGAIMGGLAGFGDLQTGTGWYSDIPPAPGFDGVHVDLNAGNTGASSGIDDMWDTGSCVVAGTFVGCGGDFAELGYAAISGAASGASWRPGSNRFIIALGDASFKDGPAAEDAASTMAALAAADADLIGVSFSGSFSADITGLGGTVFSGGGSPDDITDAIIAGVTAGFAEYDEVTVDDLGGGLPGIDVSVVCISADIGACVGDTAVGDYDRSVARTFEFDVTFTALADGEYAFPLFALVDGGIVATESDRFCVPRCDIPEPASIALFGIGLFGAALARRRRAA